MSQPCARLKRGRLTLLLALGALVYLIGIGHDLPYVVQYDEVGFFAAEAARIAAIGNLHPGWFGHPGSTTIYPLAGIYRLWHIVAHGGPWLGPAPQLWQTFEGQIGTSLLLGRLLSVAYGVGALWATYRLGRAVVGLPSSLIAVALLIPVPPLIVFAQMVRSDTATVFFTVLALWAMVRVWEHPSLGRQSLAGLACGLAISTKYTLGVLAITLVLADAALLLWARARGAAIRPLLAPMLAGLGAVIVGFVATTPYFVLDFATAWRDLRLEMRPIHLGADGLSPAQNLWWYLSYGLPTVWGWGRYVLATAGAAWLAWKGDAAERLLLAFVGLFLVGISTSPLHWERWVFPILPVLALCVAVIIWQGVRWLGSRWRLADHTQALVATLITLAVCATPLAKTVQLEITQLHPSTMVRTREWLDTHLAPGTVIAREEYSFPVNGSNLRIVGGNALAERSLESYREEGAKYIAVSSSIYERYYREPERYAEQIAFYEALDREAELVYQIAPDHRTGGPTVKVYHLPEEQR